MQPVELAYRLHGSPCFCKLAKYLTRDKEDKLKNLKKAKHCIQLEVALLNKQIGTDYVFNYTNSNKAEELIDEFTDNIEYRKALKAFYYGYEEYAIAVVDKLIKELE